MSTSAGPACSTDFYRAQYPKALALANRAYSHSDAKTIRAESCFHMARAHHAQSNRAHP